MLDAVVVGAGHNGLVAANLLADAGWDVLVLEAQDEPGGAVRSGQLTKPGFVHDLFSAFYPLAAASPHLQGLDLESYGLRWKRAPLVVAHPRGDGECAVLSQTLDETVGSLEALASGDGLAWRRMYGLWQEVSGPFVDALLGRFPPVAPAARIGAALGAQDLMRFLRFVGLPVRRMVEEQFRSETSKLLVAGNALHADVGPEVPGSGLFGWMLCCLGQEYGFPVPEGGAGRLTAALVARLEARGGHLLCGQRVDAVEIRRGRAAGVVTAEGRTIAVRRAVLADVAAPALYFDLVGAEHLPMDFVDDLRTFQFDDATVKVDWALDGPVPWTAERAGRAGTVHLARSMGHLTKTSAQLAMGLVPAEPYLVVGQMNVADPSRSPRGTQTVWAYTHLPQEIHGDAGGEGLTGSWSPAETETYVARIEREIEHYAPGFRDRIIATFVRTPPEFEAADANLVGGAVNGGTAQLHQQLVFRPTPRLARSRTPVPGLYLSSASAHPGGGVHGAAGANAARAALTDHRVRRVASVGAAAVWAGAIRRAGRLASRRAASRSGPPHHARTPR